MPFDPPSWRQSKAIAVVLVSVIAVAVVCLSAYCLRSILPSGSTKSEATQMKLGVRSKLNRASPP